MEELILPLTALIARDALGASKSCWGHDALSLYLSPRANKIQRALAKHLGIELLNLPITALI